MTITHTLENGALNVHIIGRIDVSTSGELDEFLAAHITPELKLVSLDLAQVDYISSNGLRVLVKLCKNLKDTRFEIQNPNAMVSEVLRLTGLDTFFDIKTV